MHTLPEISRTNGISLDGLRVFVRTHPDLHKLGRMAGATRVLTDAEAARILAAWREHKARRKPEAVAAAS